MPCACHSSPIDSRSLHTSPPTFLSHHIGIHASDSNCGRHPAQPGAAGSCSSINTAWLTLSTSTAAGECHRRAAPWDVAPQVCCAAAQSSSQNGQAHTCFALSALCSSINLLDARPPSAAAGDGHVTGTATSRCCLSVTAYVAAVPLAANSSSTVHSTAQHAPGSSARSLAASFRICKNSTGSGCIAALLTDTSSSTGLYRVALLLPAQAGQQTADSSAHGTNSSQEAPQPAGGDAPSSPAASTHTTAAAAPAQHSGVHDMLLTVHAEQEVTGRVYLMISSQLVRAGRRRPANTSTVCLQQQL